MTMIKHMCLFFLLQSPKAIQPPTAMKDDVTADGGDGDNACQPDQVASHGGNGDDDNVGGTIEHKTDESSEASIMTNMPKQQPPVNTSSVPLSPGKPSSSNQGAGAPSSPVPLSPGKPSPMKPPTQPSSPSNQTAATASPAKQAAMYFGSATSAQPVFSLGPINQIKIY